MKKKDDKIARIPKNYDGKRNTCRHVKDLLPKVLSDFLNLYQEQGEDILQAWPDIVGDQIAKMSRPISFKNGILKIFVNNSTLLSLLKEHEKQRLLLQYKKKFPDVEIKEIFFQLG